MKTRFRLTASFCVVVLFSAVFAQMCGPALAQAGDVKTATSAGTVSAPQNTSPFDSLAPTPPMGWASWNHFFCDYDENTIRAQAAALVSTGMRDAGYRYVLIQECIARERDAQGNLIADSVRFPSGMPALTAYIHSLGLKAGIYTDVGRHTCFDKPRYQGSYGHEQQDADTFAAWGMDLVEMDFCNREKPHSGRWVYERMAAAIRKTGRPMIFYLCSWGNEEPWEWAQGKAQMWRTEGDISLEKNHVEWANVVRNFETNTSHSVFSGPESWNDADMLEIGNPGLNDAEARAQMSMWAISPSPLLAGADLTHLSAEARATYLNKEVLAVNQDALGAGAEKISESGPGIEVWAKPLGTRTSGNYAVMLLNASAENAAMEIRWRQLDLLPKVAVRDLWLHKDVSAGGDGYRAMVPSRSAVLLRISGIRAWRRGVVYEAESPAVVRSGMTTLFRCAACSRGYAVAIGGENHAGALRFSGMMVPEAGQYTLRLRLAGDRSTDAQVGVEVNGMKENHAVMTTKAGWIDVPVELRAGVNDITVLCHGKQSFSLDNLTLARRTQPGAEHVAEHGN
jgi:alpha-galactosidase